MSETSSFQQQLIQLHDQFTQQLPSRIRQIDKSWQFICEQSSGDVPLASLYQQVQQLADSGATFGFSALSQQAHTLQSYLAPYLQNYQAFNQVQRDWMQVMLDELKHAADKADSPVTWSAPPPHAESGLAHVLLVVHPDEVITTVLQDQLSFFGYQVYVANQLDALEGLLTEYPQALILMNDAFPGDDQAGIKQINTLQQQRQQPLAVIFFSQQMHLSYRLAMIQAGSIAVFDDPQRVSAILDKLDNLLNMKRVDNSRVLLLDTDPMLNEYFSLLLQQAGFEVQSCHHSDSLLATLQDFRPDLLVVDIALPKVNGITLVSAVRQMEAFSALPVIFMTHQHSDNLQLTTAGFGTDVFLPKPIQGEALLSAAIGCIKRADLQQSYMTLDYLTGLYHYSAIKIQLKREISRAVRSKEPLSFALLEIDGLDQINEQHSLATGDKVQQALARLLTKRLRTSDMLGRYGGEELAVILVNCHAEQAQTILEGIAKDFARLQHGDEEHATFTASVCAGIANLQQFGNINELTEAVELSLKQAKQQASGTIQIAQQEKWDVV